MSQLISYKSQDGIEHYLHLFACETPDAPVLLLFPAMGMKAPYYFKLAEHINQQGFHFACTDLRGNGPSHRSPSWLHNFSYHEMLEQDWPAAIEKIKHNLPNSPLFLMGHSLGGQLSCCYAALHPDNISGVILIASGTVHYKTYRQKWRTLFGTQFLWYTSAVIGYLPGTKLGFAGNEARGVMRDWAYNARTGRYRIKNKNQSNALEGTMSQFKKPILAITFDGDKLSPHGAMQALLDKFHNAHKTHIRTSALELGVKKLDHFNWVHSADKLSPKIGNWIKKVSGIND